jgi:hypothetical protein
MWPYGHMESVRIDRVHMELYANGTKSICTLRIVHIDSVHSHRVPNMNSMHST